MTVTEDFEQPVDDLWYGRQYALDRFFMEQEVPRLLAQQITTRGRVEHRPRGHVISYGQEWVHIVVSGCVLDASPHGAQRIWGKGAIIGDLTPLHSPPDKPRRTGTGPRIVFLAESFVVSLTVGTLLQVVAEDPHTALFLLKLVNTRAATVESVYANAHLRPHARVAKLFDYLGVIARSHRWRYTRAGLRSIQPGALTVEGPSQVDIAQALGLGRATVEKALAYLRSEGVLKSPQQRHNRFFEVEDVDRLRTIALGGS
ncbi:Crp/Fnr family transcriptional regulator [Streptomyces sp. NPDC091040]|uniref:Crp/Fnr family transcriptional regulator n=1 Tax=Streptomyces sp. NPDC091040 TaxID=3365972 RepID=UPI00382DF5D3